MRSSLASSIRNSLFPNRCGCRLFAAWHGTRLFYALLLADAWLAFLGALLLDLLALNPLLFYLL